MLPSLRTPSIFLLAVAAALGCSSKSSHPVDTSTPTDDTWSDGKHLTASVTIPFGSSVTIAPGARVTFNSGVRVTVQGTLKSASRSAHAKLDGSGWGGLEIVTGGVLQLDGVDIANADTALSVQGGQATYQYGAITASGPFDVGKDGKLDVAHSTVVGSTRASGIVGTFTATFMDYDANTFEGIVAQDAAASVSIEDSMLHAQSTEDNDLVVAKGAATVHVAYSDLTKAHCGFHFDSITAFDVSHVSVHDGSFGFMLYGSATDGTRTISASNIFNNKGRGAEEETQNTINGTITISDGYWANNGATADDNLRQFTGQIKVANMSTTTPLTGAGPRGPVP